MKLMESKAPLFSSSAQHGALPWAKVGSQKFSACSRHWAKTRAQRMRAASYQHTCTSGNKFPCEEGLKSQAWLAACPMIEMLRDPSFKRLLLRCPLSRPHALGPDVPGGFSHRSRHRNGSAEILVTQETWRCISG